MDVVFTVIYGVIIDPPREKQQRRERAGWLAEGHARPTARTHAQKPGSRLAFLPRGPF